MSDGAALLRGHRRTWLAVAAVVVAGAGAALAPQPVVVDDAASRSTFAALASAAIVALAMLPLAVWRSRARPKAWMAVAIVALALGLGSFSAGGYAQRACIASYAGTPVIIGTELTPLGTTYVQANPELSSAELLFDAAGAAERIWTRTSINRCSALVSSTHFLWIPFLVVCLLATVQAVATTKLLTIGRGTPTARADAPVAARYDVFMSYRHDGADAEFAHDLVEALEADGYRVAIDERDFPANASFLQEMERCVRESRFTVAVISPRYFDSGHTEEEAIITKVLDMGDRRRRLIPVVIEQVAMPAWLYGIVGIDWTKRDPVVDPLEKLKATLGTPLGRQRA